MTEKAKTTSTPSPNAKLRFERERRAWSQQQLADELGTTPLNISRWERGITQPGPHLRGKLCELFAMTAQQLGLIVEKDTDQPVQPVVDLPTEPVSKASEAHALWNVAYRRNPFFTGREGILAQVRDAFTSGDAQSIALAQPQAISGLGGIGKTQTAVEYAYRYREQYEDVFWVRADSYDLLVSDFVLIANLLTLPQRNEQEQDKIVQAVIHWLDTHNGWLLILDNADDLNIVRDFMPTAGKGHVILTTRAQATGTMAQRIEMEKMSLEEGALFLLQRIKRLKHGATLQSVNETLRQQAQAIVEVLDGLPLALDQAGAYIEETNCNLTDYLKFYKTRRNRLLRTRGRDATGHPEPVATTWSLSFEKVEHANPAAAELLKLCAFLHPDAIPESMIMEGASELGPVLGPIAADELDFNEAIGELHKYSLIKRDTEENVLNIHRLVQVVVRDEMDKVEEQQWVERIVRMLSKVFPKAEYVVWEKCQRYLPHALICTNMMVRDDVEAAKLALLAHKVANYIVERGQYTEATRLYKQSLELRKKILTPVHLDIADSLHALGMMYWRQGNYQGVEPYLLEALQIREQILGFIHQDIADSYNDLAVLYDNQGKYEQAEASYNRSMGIWEQIPDASPADMATTLCNLALFYSRNGKYLEAEQLHKRALALRQKLFGDEHPEVATSIHQMGILYFHQGKFAEAADFWQRALVLREKALGSVHPDVAFTVNNLAVLYSEQGQYKQAEEMHLRALAMREEILGPIHPEVAHSLGNIAALYRDQKRFAEAELLQQRALSIREKVYGGLNHADVGFSFNHLAWLKYDQGMYAEAEEFFERALALRERLLGEEHKDTVYTLSGLAALYRDEGRYEQSESLFLKALAIQERVLDDHHEKAFTLDGLAYLYLMREQYEQAEPLFLRALAIREKSLSSDHPDLATTLENYATLLHKTNREDEAAALEARAQAIRAKPA